MKMFNNIKSFLSYGLVLGIIVTMTGFALIRFISASIEYLFPGYSNIKLYGFMFIGGFLILAISGYKLSKIVKR